MTHTVEVPQDADSSLTLTLDTEYRLNTRAWQDWHGNRIETVPPSSDGFYSEGTEVRVRAVPRPPAEFLGWNGGVSGRNAEATVVMDDGQLAEAAFALDATELQSGVPARVSLEWQGADLRFHELDFERHYVLVPPDATEFEVRFDTQAATAGAEAGLWVADQDLWPGWVASPETADLILGDGDAGRFSIGRPSDGWPAAYTILVRAAESNASRTHTLEGTLVATVSRDPIPNRPPQAVGTVAPLRIWSDSAMVAVDVASAFRDPDGDMLTFAAVSSSPGVAAVVASGDTVTVTPGRPGTARVTVTAKDPSRASAVQQFTVTVVARATFTDHPIRPGATAIKAVHFAELRERIDALREAAGLGRFAWTDPFLTAGVTPVRVAHLLELREALTAAYASSARAEPQWTDAATMAGLTPIRAAQVMELRAAVLALE